MSEYKHWSLGYLRERGYRLTATCHNGHSAQLDLSALVERLGPDTNLVAQRASFLATLKCSRCGASGSDLTLNAPDGR